MASKLPTNNSRLQPPGSLSKTKRGGGSIDLESGLDAKKAKTAGEGTANGTGQSNLIKSKSKSMMNIAGAGRPGTGATTSQRSSVRTSTSSTSGTGARSKLAPSTSRNPPLQRSNTVLHDKTNTTRTTSTSSKSGPNSGTSKPGKRPAWDLKGKMEDMERKMEETHRRLEMMETQKQELQEDVEVKHEVVVKSSEQIRNLQKKIEESEALIEELRKKAEEKEDSFNKETLRLKRALEEEEFTKTSLQRKMQVLEDELSVKQSEVLALKTSVAELSSSRAAVEASLATSKNMMEDYRAQIQRITEESEEKSRLLAESKKIQEQQEAKLNWEETERRKLHNIIQELKGNIRVFGRVRPLLGAEKESGDIIRHINITDEKNLELLKIKEGTGSSIAGGLNKDMKYDFEFDRVFGPESTQAQVFLELSQLVQSALDGYNVCVFAYGQTGSGKTFTMEGGEDAEEDEEQAGMIPRTIHQIFATQERLKEKQWKYDLKASFLEIYNEEIRDLLATEKDLKYDIKMTEGKGSDLYVTNLKIEEVTSGDQVAKLLRRAGKNRAQARTLCNERSSRSHSVFILRIEGRNEATSETCCGTLNLVDLAGSERIKDSGSEGVRLTEAQAINKSLSNLGNVIMALAQKSNHVPYRNSKLTHLLQNSLGGNSKTLMFVNVNPKEECFSETLNSLRFATKVNQCNIGTAQKKAK